MADLSVDAEGAHYVTVDGRKYGPFTAAAIAEDFPRSILPHLDRWLAANVHGDTCRAAVRDRLLAFIADDTEYYTCQSWPHVYDLAKCWDVEREYR